MLFKVTGIVRLLIILLAGLGLLQACTQDNGSGSGRVSVLVTDDPSAEFDQVNLTVDSIQMIGEGPDVFLTKQPVRFNLLDLRNFSTMLAVNDQVPVGTYSKLRMDVSNIELVKLNSDGSVAETIVPRLPSGRIDLNPKEQITVVSGGDLVIEFDIDAEKSIHIVTTGNGGYIFRPQVFVELMNNTRSSLIRLTGIALDVQLETFVLCEASTATVNDDCRQIKINADTVVMNGDIEVSNYSIVSNGDPVLVFGFFDSSSNIVNAARVFDDVSMLPSFRGTFNANVSVDAADYVISRNTSGLAVGNVLAVSPLSASAVFDDLGHVLDISAIAIGVNAEVIGILKPDMATATEIRPGLIIVESP